MFNQRSEQKELMDDLAADQQELRQNLLEIEKINRWSGSKKTLICALRFLYKKFPDYFHTNRLTIADLGCGGGDL